ncbi:NADH:ubiquinone oxidoreductase 20.1kD subunit [Xylaria sp. CBS 124048]|nr:NADH:ubiquinone oxidoreductase 20.1kD subunit [Xylaria sp. CBS 124048]
MAAARRLPIVQQRTMFPDHYKITSSKILDEKYPELEPLSEAEDPEMNGGYENPPPIPRQFRDPHGDWWDKQERRNFGEPLHEDNDMLGMFSPHHYTWINARDGLAQVGVFIAVLLGVCWVVGKVYPDKPAFPREFEAGLQRELGGPGAARAPGDPEPFQAQKTK